MLAWQWLIAFLALGSLVGFMAGLLGIGGGAIMVPVLSALFVGMGFAPASVMHMALGTSMASIIVTSFASMKAHHRHAGVLWAVVKKMSPGIILGTFVSTFFASKIPGVYLVIIFSAFMTYVALQLLLNIKPAAHRELPQAVGLFGAGVFIGGVSALVSIGGGSLTVPYLSWCNVDVKKAIGTSAAIGLPISVAGTGGYIFHGWSLTTTQPYALGYIYLPAVLLISVTSFFSAPIGAKLAQQLPVSVLKRAFAVLIAILCVKCSVPGGSNRKNGCQNNYWRV